MSSEQTFSTADLRSNAQDFKRDAAHKHKWALGSVEGVGRAEGKPRPQRPSETSYSFSRRVRGAAVAHLHNGAKLDRKHDLNDRSDSSESNSDNDFGVPSPATDPNVIYSFDAARSPSHGSQILNLALAKAVEKFEDRETTKLVNNEYDVLDSEGDTVASSSAGKGKGKAKRNSAAIAAAADVDEDYEFV